MSAERFNAREIAILHSIDLVDWYSQLWFPAVLRDALNLPDDGTDAEMHEAIFSLIARGVLEVWRHRAGSSVRVDDTTEIPDELRAFRYDHDADAWLTLVPRDGVIAEIEERERRRWTEIRRGGHT